MSKFDRGEPFPVGSAITLQPPSKAQTLKARKVRHQVQKKQYVDRRKRLQTNLKRAATKAAKLDQSLAKAMSNERQDAKKLAVITKQKEMAEASVKKVQADLSIWISSRSRRAPKTFDLTTRNGAIGNYHFSGLSSET